MSVTSKEYIATITSKGQITIPAEVRQQLRLSPHDKVILRVVGGMQLTIELLPMTLESSYGSVSPLNRPEDFGRIMQIADEERATRWLNKANQ